MKVIKLAGPQGLNRKVFVVFFNNELGQNLALNPLNIFLFQKIPFYNSILLKIIKIERKRKPMRKIPVHVYNCRERLKLLIIINKKYELFTTAEVYMIANNKHFPIAQRQNTCTQRVPHSSSASQLYSK